MQNYTKEAILLISIFISTIIYAQKDSLQLGDQYWEDQLYINVSYNTLHKQPKGISASGFSYGLSAGYIKDISIVKTGKFALGIGLGYGFDSFNHDLKVIEGNPNIFETKSNITNNRFLTHNIELPIEFRWRTSTANTYSFWRFYAGAKLSYNLKNNFNYIDAGKKISFSGLSEFNKFQTGFIASAGYGTFNFHIYYGLTSIFKNASLNGIKINTNIVRFGLSFYLL